MGRCLIVQHVEPERAFAVAGALDAAGVEVETARVFAGDRVPVDVGGLGGLVVMGGPMSARSDDGFPTREAELALVREAVGHDVPTLGVCLGAQLLAAAAGGSVIAGRAGPEIGWGPVELTGEASDDALLAGLPEHLPVLHWHGETFEIPPGACRLATTSRYREQAFRVGARAWGFQFHLEVDEHAVRRFLEAFGDDARRAGTDPASIEQDTGPALETLAPHRDAVCARFASIVASHR